MQKNLAVHRLFVNSTSAGSSSSSHVPKLGYHSRGSLALLPLGSPASVFIALSATESEVLPSLAANLLPSGAASFVGYPRTCRRLPRPFSLSNQLCPISAPSFQSAPLVLVLLSSWATLHLGPLSCRWPQASACPSNDEPAVHAYRSVSARARCAYCIL